jgi:hypothetical protein
MVANTFGELMQFIQQDLKHILGFTVWIEFETYAKQKFVAYFSNNKYKIFTRGKLIEYEGDFHFSDEITFPIKYEVIDDIDKLR